MKLTARFLRFAAIGGVGFVIDTGLLYLLLGTGVGPYLGRAVSLPVAATCTWFGNRRLTFATGPKPGGAMRREWVSYLGAMLLGGLVNYAIYAVLIWRLAMFAAYPVLAVVVATAFSMLLNFTTARWILRQPAGR